MRTSPGAPLWTEYNRQNERWYDAARVTIQFGRLPGPDNHAKLGLSLISLS